MGELKIGEPKANALRDILRNELATPSRGAGRLHLVTDETPYLAGPSEPIPAPDAEAVPAPAEPEASPQPTDDGHPGTVDAPRTTAFRSWPVLLLAVSASVAIWSGWVGLGGLTGFGIVHPLPGIWDEATLNTAITLPIGVETYAAFALRVVPARARRFAKWSAIGSLVLGALGQVAYHLMAAADVASAPWPITTVVACLPVAVLGMGAALAHLLREHT